MICLHTHSRVRERVCLWVLLMNQPNESHSIVQCSFDGHNDYNHRYGVWETFFGHNAWLRCGQYHLLSVTLFHIIDDSHFPFTILCHIPFTHLIPSRFGYRTSLSAVAVARFIIFYCVWFLLMLLLLLLPLVAIRLSEPDTASIFFLCRMCTLVIWVCMYVRYTAVKSSRTVLIFVLARTHINIKKINKFGSAITRRRFCCYVRYSIPRKITKHSAELWTNDQPINVDTHETSENVINLN